MREIVEFYKGKQTRVFSSMLQLKECNLDYRYVNQCARNLRKSYKGRTYVYKDSISNTQIEERIRKINCYNLKGELIKQYDRISDTKFDGFEPKLVSRCLSDKNTIVRHMEHYWTYEDIKLSIPTNKTTNRSIKVNMIEDDKIIHTFNSIQEARRNGFYDNGIKLSIKNNATYLGYRWEYIK